METHRVAEAILKIFFLSWDVLMKEGVVVLGGSVFAIFRGGRFFQSNRYQTVGHSESSDWWDPVTSMVVAIEKIQHRKDHHLFHHKEPAFIPVTEC